MDEGYGWVVMRMTTGHLRRANEMRIPGSRRGSGERRGGDLNATLVVVEGGTIVSL